jgi:hypothetical protein
VFPGWHFSLPLQGPNIRFPRSNLRLHSNGSTFLSPTGSSTPTSFSLSLVSLSVHLFSHSSRASARPYAKSSSPVQFVTQHKYWCLVYRRCSAKERLGKKHQQFEDPTRLSNTPTYGSHLKGFAQQPFEASASRASGQRTSRTSGQ